MPCTGRTGKAGLSVMFVMFTIYARTSAQLKGGKAGTGITADHIVQNRAYY